jgi:hypothetical protein
VILAAALLVLVGLGLFVGGWLTGTTVLYWLCVVACVAAGVFLLLARARIGRTPSAPTGPTSRSERPAEQRPASTGATAVRVDAAPPERTVGRDWETTVAPVGDPAAPPVVQPPVAEPGAPEPVTGEPGVAEHWSAEPAFPEPPSTAAHAHRGSPGAQDASGDPPVEEVEVTDLLLVVDLRDDVLVVDEHPRYHLDRCRWLAGRETIPIPLDEARTDGFTPCGWCEPDRTLAERERGRRAGRNN